MKYLSTLEIKLLSSPKLIILFCWYCELVWLILLLIYCVTTGVWAGRRDSPVQVTVDKSPKGDLLAAGDTRGNIRLYRWVTSWQRVTRVVTSGSTDW